MTQRTGSHGRRQWIQDLVRPPSLAVGARLPHVWPFRVSEDEVTTANALRIEHGDHCVVPKRVAAAPRVRRRHPIRRSPWPPQTVDSQDAPSAALSPCTWAPRSTDDEGVSEKSR
jgi:hypothetical protein